MPLIDPPTSPPDATTRGSAAAAAPPPTGNDAGDVLCPMCEYNLHGLIEPRCPECGYTFDWPDLRDPTRRKHKYLFEHHPERNLWSFMRTAIAGFVPWRFWRSLRPDQPSNVRRLILYWLLTAWGPFIVPIGLYTLTGVIHHYNYAPMRARIEAWVAQPVNAQQTIQSYGSVEAYLDTVAPVAPSRAFFRFVWLTLRDDTFALITTPCFAWLPLPWLTALSLMIFQATMRRARVRGAHVLRCCLYSFDTGLWFGVIGVAFVAAAWIQFALNPNAPPRLAMMSPTIAGGGAAVLSLLAVAKLFVAYRLYMRFPHAITTVVLALFLTALALLIGAANAPGLDWRLYEVWNALRWR
jgi:hypothetical protein